MSELHACGGSSVGADGAQMQPSHEHEDEADSATATMTVTMAEHHQHSSETRMEDDEEEKLPNVQLVNGTAMPKELAEVENMAVAVEAAESSPSQPESTPLSSATAAAATSALPNPPTAAIPAESPAEPISISGSSSDGSDSDDDTGSCVVCGGVGCLLLCDTCPCAFHLRCAGLKRMPGGSGTNASSKTSSSSSPLWSCPVCTGQHTLDEYRRRRQLQRSAQRFPLLSKRGRRSSSRRRRTRSRTRQAESEDNEIDEQRSDIDLPHIARQIEAEDKWSYDLDTDAPLLPSQPTCAFCHRPELSSRSGFIAPSWPDPARFEFQLVGPFFEGGSASGGHGGGHGQMLWAHRSCAVWSPRVFALKRTEQDNTKNGRKQRRGRRHDQSLVSRLQNVVSEVQRSRWLNCSRCGKRGASIGCFEKACPKSFHYQCAKESQCCMLLPGYEVYCPLHSLPRNLRGIVNMPPELFRLRMDNIYALLDGSIQLKRVTLADRMKRDGAPGSYSATELYEALIESEAARFKPSPATPTSMLRPRSQLEMARQIRVASLPDEEERKRLKHAEKRVRSLEEERMHEQKERARASKKRRKENMLLSVGDVDCGNHADRESLLQQLDPSSMIDDVSTTTEEGDAWSQVGGLSQHIRSIQECILLPLMYPEIFRRRHIRPPKGVLLVGPPGTGKTLLARCLARACSSASSSRPITFFSRKGADILSKFHGESELTLRTLFMKAREAAPSIIYFDELDALVPTRNSKQNQVHSSIVTTLLALMDGLDTKDDEYADTSNNDASSSSKLVFILGSTNRPESIDPALRRSGRFDRELVVGIPNHAQRLEILRVHTRSWPDGSKPSPRHLESIARASVGYSGADLKALCNEAALAAAHRVLGPGLIGQMSADARNGEDVPNTLGQSTDPSASPDPSPSASDPHVGASSSSSHSAPPFSPPDPSILARLPSVHVLPCDFSRALTTLSASSSRSVDGQASGFGAIRFMQQGGSNMHNPAMRALMASKMTEARSVLDLPTTSKIQQTTSNEMEEVDESMEDWMDGSDLAVDTPSSSLQCSSSQSTNSNVTFPSDPLSIPLSSIPRLPRSSLHRLLICDSNPPPSPPRFRQHSDGSMEPIPWNVDVHPLNSSLLASTLLSSLDLDSVVTHQVDLLSLLMDREAWSVEEACVRCFHMARRNKNNIFYLPRLDEWWQRTSTPSMLPLRGALISCLSTLCALSSGDSCLPELTNSSAPGLSSSATATNKNGITIFIATSGCCLSDLHSSPELDLHPFLKTFFHTTQVVQCTKPNPISLRRFFNSLLRDTAMNMTTDLAHFMHRQQQKQQMVAEQHAGVVADHTSSSDMDTNPSQLATAEQSTSPSPMLSVLTSSLSVALSIPSSPSSSSSTTLLLPPLVSNLVTSASSCNLTYLDCQELQQYMNRWSSETIAELETSDGSDGTSESSRHHSLRLTLAQLRQALMQHSQEDKHEGTTLLAIWQELLQSIHDACGKAMPRRE